ncbi:hypothetical protein Dimus_007962, partial [Dionaea muscipula]
MTLATTAVLPGAAAAEDGAADLRGGRCSLLLLEAAEVGAAAAHTDPLVEACQLPKPLAQIRFLCSLLLCLPSSLRLPLVILSMAESTHLGFFNGSRRKHTVEEELQASFIKW